MTTTLQTLRDLIRYGVTRFEEAGLFYGHGTDNAFDEAAFIVLEALRLPPDSLDTLMDARVTTTERKRILGLFAARVKTRKPASYLLNKAYLQGLPFYIDERALVPRSFIAEILCGDHTPVADPDGVQTVLDLCTGSGCLAVLAAHLFPDALIDAADLSPDALAVAERNVADYGLEDRVTMHHGDLFAALPERARYDLIIANPPYVDADGMDHLPPEFEAEPAMALAAGTDGLSVVRRILADAPRFLADGDSLLICEIGRCRPALQDAFPDLPFVWFETENSAGEVFGITRRALESRP